MTTEVARKENSSPRRGREHTSKMNMSPSSPIYERHDREDNPSPVRCAAAETMMTLFMNSSREAEERLTREQKRDHQTVKKIRAKGNHKKVFGDYNEAATAASAQTSFKKSKSIASKPVPKLKKVQPPSVEIAGAERTNLNPTAVDVKMETFDDSDDVLPRKIKKKGDLKCVREFDPRLIQENIRMGRYT
ncbi:hypothetical protein AaE_006448, partial [Aphanomyces astaci]